MNKTISLAAIAMVAVIMGMSAFAPAAMADNPRAWYCHWQEGDQDYKVKKAGEKSGHLDHELDLGPFDTRAEALAECPVA